MLRAVHARTRRRWAGKQVTANCVHPGEVATSFGSGAGGVIPYVFAVIHLFGSSPEQGASRIVQLASSHAYAGITGRYFYKDQLARPNPQAADRAASRAIAGGEV